MTYSRSGRVSLTPRQNEVYEFIRERIRTQGAPPTIPEVCERFGMASTNAGNDVLNALERKGYIRRVKGRARGIQLVDGAGAPSSSGSGTRRLPIVGEGSAENPMGIFMNPQGTYLPDPVLFPAANSFVAIVGDDGMDGEGIVKGDLVVVEQRSVFEDGALAFALIGNVQAVRRVDGPPGRRFLAAANRRYPRVRVIDGAADLALLGVPVGLIRTLREESPGEA